MKFPASSCAGTSSTTCILRSVCAARGTQAGSCVPIRTKEGAITPSRHGVAALLNWHFTDRYYHTNLDTIDKVSETTMGNVATAVATTAMFLAAADRSDREALAKLVNEAERARMETERINTASAEILAAWSKWYGEARASVDILLR